MQHTREVFDWADPFRLVEQLTSEERMVQDTAHAYAQEKLAPRVLDAFRNEKTDPEIFREMGELGLLGPTISPDYGGAYRLRRLRPDRPRSRTGRQWLSFDDERPVFAGDGAD